MKNNLEVAQALLAGFVAGVAVGIVLAKETGSDTQAVLSVALKNLGITIKEIAANGINKLADLKKDILKVICVKDEQPLPDDLEHA